MENDTFDRKAAAKAQEEFTTKMKYPHFAPYTGRCWTCDKNIYDEVEHKTGDITYKTGISVESAGEGHITFCPHCHTSYCD